MEYPASRIHFPLCLMFLPHLTLHLGCVFGIWWHVLEGVYFVWDVFDEMCSIVFFDITLVLNMWKNAGGNLDLRKCELALMEVEV